MQKHAPPTTPPTFTQPVIVPTYDVADHDDDVDIYAQDINNPEDRLIP